ncbi:MAG: DUF2764 family protein [Bacteroidetes bacterium]|nr:DUF2764 family protein [Bacteroidota bacterium]
MFERLYHCYVAGLYDLALDDGKNLLSMDEFREALKEILHPDDYMLARILFLPVDNKNLIRYLAGKPAEHAPLGNYPPESFDEQVLILDSIIRVDDILPSYMVEVIKQWIASEKSIDLIKAEKRLTEGYFNLISDCGSNFLKKWSEFEINLTNILTLKNSMDLGIDAAEQIVGNNALAEELRIISRRKADFRVPPEPDYASLVFNIAGESEFLERELKIDQLRWNYSSELVFFEYFTIDYILGYMVKLSIALRWKALDAETGEAMLRKIVSELKNSNESPPA